MNATAKLAPDSANPPTRSISNLKLRRQRPSGVATPKKRSLVWR